MVFRKDDPETIKAGKKGARSRRKPYYNFLALKEKDPKKLKAIQSKGGKSKTPQ